MDKGIIRFLAPAVIVLIVGLFIYNVVSHGSVVNPGKPEYLSQCAQCHGDEGEGIKELVPPLIKSDFAIQNIDSLPCWIKNGLNHPIVVNGRTFDQPMYPADLDEVRIANVINYINSEFLHNDKEVSSGWVRDRLRRCK